MHATASASSDSGDELVLPIADAAHMFNAPPIDARSPGLPEILGVSGADYALGQLQSTRSKARALVLIVPDSQASPNLAEQTQRSLERYARYRIQQEETGLRDVRRRGWRATGIALVLLAAFLTLASLVGSEFGSGIPQVVRAAIEHGLEILAWVMLWHPIELVVFSPFEYRDKIAALRRLEALHVVVRPGLAVPHLASSVVY